MSVSEWASYIKGQLMSNLPLTTGKVNSNGNVGWIPISFNVPFETPPQVFVQGYVKYQAPAIQQVVIPTVQAPRVEIAEVTIPTFEVPAVNITPVVIPNMQIPTFNLGLAIPNWKTSIPGGVSLQTYMYDEAWKAIREQTAILNWPPANVIRDVFSFPIAYLIGWTGSIISWVIDTFLWPQIEQINDKLRLAQETINYNVIGASRTVTQQVGTRREVIDYTETGRPIYEYVPIYETITVATDANSINSKLSQLNTILNGTIAELTNALNQVYIDMSRSVEASGSAVQSGVNQFRDRINDALIETQQTLNLQSNEVKVRVEEALNNSIGRLYEHMGALRPDGTPDVSIPIVSPQIRNVSRNGFEFYATGGTYDWVAVGAKVGAADVASYISQGEKILAGLGGHIPR